MKKKYNKDSIGYFYDFTQKPKNTNIFTISEEESRSCKFDNLLFESHRMMIKYAKRVHEIKDFEEYIIKAYYDGKCPVCKCDSCRESSEPALLKFKPLKCGPFFKDYAQNHWPHKPHTEEAKELIREKLEALYDGETPLKQKVREGVLRKVNQIHSKENTEKRLAKCEDYWNDDERNKPERKKRSEDMKDRWDSGTAPFDPSRTVDNMRENDPEKYESWRRQVSVNASEQQKRDGPNFQYCLKCRVKNPFTNEWEKLGSSWELLFVRWCYAMNMKYTRNKNTISYTNHKGNWALYTPDFILPESKELIEVKGAKDDNTSLKRQVAIEWCKENGFTHVYLEFKELSDVGLDLNKRTIKKRVKTILLVNRETMFPVNPRKWFGVDCEDFKDDKRIPENS